MAMEPCSDTEIPPTCVDIQQADCTPVPVIESESDTSDSACTTTVDSGMPLTVPVATTPTTPPSKMICVSTPSITRSQSRFQQVPITKDTDIRFKNRSSGYIYVSFNEDHELELKFCPKCAYNWRIKLYNIFDSHEFQTKDNLDVLKWRCTTCPGSTGFYKLDD